MGLGEAACLAAAAHRGCVLASYERGVFRRIACERIGESRVLTTPSILSRAVKTGAINLGELRDAKGKLDGNRFRMPPARLEESVATAASPALPLAHSMVIGINRNH